MLEQKKIHELNDYFIELHMRREKSIYFSRINGYNDTIHDFLKRYYQQARKTGVVIEGKIPNPDEKNLAYYSEIMGTDFQMSVGFFSASLKKWLPRMNAYQNNTISAAIYDTLDDMRKQGKNENMLKNAYIKFMCWMYYKFEGILNLLGENTVPKCLYEGSIGVYELKLMLILAKAGCDVVLVQYNGDQGYLKIDPSSQLSQDYKIPDMMPFPQEFSLEHIRKEMVQKENMKRLYGTPSTLKVCTNAWIKGEGLEDILTSVRTRGEDSSFFYNSFYRINGVEDKLTYLPELYKFYQKLENNGRKILVFESAIPARTTEEISGIARTNYNNRDEMFTHLSKNIQYSTDIELQRLMTQRFIEVMLEVEKRPNMNLNKLTSKAVSLLCWIKRYQPKLFQKWKMPEISCVIYLGGCKTTNEAVFIKFLSGLPTDILILSPNLNIKCVLEDSTLYEKNYPTSLVVDNFPDGDSDIHIGTAAYHAERELDTMMYSDSGMYRDQQYQKGTSIILQTMYEEISLLWNEELKYRPNFATLDNQVTIPVIFSKISGVKDGAVNEYWAKMKTMVTEDTLVASNVPFLQPTDPNPMKAHAATFLKNGRLQKSAIRSHSAYQYGFLRDEMQEHILNKLEILLSDKLIKGTFENGTEYTIVSTILNLDKKVLRLIQKFDFTKKNPKVIYIHTSEGLSSIEDSILLAFLNLVGFDISVFVPTGYQCIEIFFNKEIMEEHHIGTYVYDLQVPNLRTPAGNPLSIWSGKIFKRGG